MHAFSASQATSSVLTNLPAAADPVASTSGNYLYVPLLNNLFATFGLGATLGRLQLQSPSLLAIQPYDVSPVDAAALPSSPLAIEMMQTSPFKLTTDEPLQCLVTNGGTENDAAFVFLSDGPIAPVTGEIIRARATATSSSTGNTWQNATITMTNPLAEGTYNLVGARLEGSHLIAGRFVFPAGAATTRPGCIATNSVSKLSYEAFRDGNLGVWGTFSNRVLPTIDLWSDGTSETVTMILDLIKTG